MTVLSLRDISLAISGNPVLEGVNLDLKENDFLGIIGPNGGGKTTLLKVILGLLKPDRGSISLFGGPVGEGRKYIGYVPQFSSFEKDYPVNILDVVLMGRLGRKRVFQNITKADIDIADQSLERVGLSGYRDRMSGSLSGGERQRLLIARALASEPRLLLLDEPTASVDSGQGMNFYNLLSDLNEKLSIVLVSHDIGAIARSVKTVACLNRNFIYHGSKEITREMIENAYHCPVDLIAHGLPHRVFAKEGENI